MSNQLLSLKHAMMSPEDLTGPLCHSYRPPKWSEVVNEILNAEQTPENERILLDTLSFKGKFGIYIDDITMVCSSMSPEESIRSLSAQILNEWLGESCWSMLCQLSEQEESVAVRSIINSILKIENGSHL